MKKYSISLCLHIRVLVSREKEQEGYKIIAKRFYLVCNMWKQRNERPTVGSASLRRRNSAPSRSGCVVNSQKDKASNK